MRSVSIVIPNWNGRELLAEYFGSVVAAAEEYRARAKAEVELIVVDDASTDDGRKWLGENFSANEFVRLVELDENVGFLRAVNKGFETAKYDVVFLLNNDVKVEPDCIAPLVKHFEDENVFAVCCRADRINGGRLDGGGKIGTFERGFWRVFLNYEALPSEANSNLISFFGSGGYTIYDRRKCNALAGFQDCLSPNYWEDVEICYRAWKRGWTVQYEPSSLVHHLGSASMSKVDRGEMDIVTERNRLLMTWINLHDRGWFIRHLGWLMLKLAGSAISFRWNYLRSFGRAVSKISKVREARRIERKAAVVSDRELADKFVKLVTEPGIYVVKDEQAETRFSEMKAAGTPEIGR
jgi:GT2 family glycosyltransferase